MIDETHRHRRKNVNEMMKMEWRKQGVFGRENRQSPIKRLFMFYETAFGFCGEQVVCDGTVDLFTVWCIELEKS